MQAKPKLFLTGKTGFLGQNLVDKLGNDYEILCYRRGDTFSSLKDFQPDIIIHGAAEVYNSDKMFDSNIRLTYDLLEAASNVGFRAFVNIGSSSEYGKKDGPISEDEVLCPRNMYEATKASATLLCQAYADKYDLPIVTARPFSLYGPFEKSRRLFPTILNAAKTGTKLKVYPGVHDWIRVDDFIRGICLLFNSPKQKIKGDVVNFGTGTQKTNREVIALFENALEQSIDCEYQEVYLRSYDSTSWVCDPSYAASRYGFKAEISLEEGIKRYVIHC